MSTTVQVNGIPTPRVVVGESGSKIVGLLITGGSGSVPTTVTIANEASDTTCFPLFVTAATGDLGPKTNAGLTFNSSTGVLGATGFSGPLTGNVTGNVSGSSGSCTGNAATATLASTVTVVDGTDATSFVCIFDSATGSLAPKTDAKLTYDATTGILTASGGYGGLAAIATAGILTGNTLWVDAVNGNDTTGTTDRQDLPYLTLAAAKAAASSGDLIHVRPGAYTPTASLAKAGVNWHFEAGATVTMTSDSPGTRIGIWDDGGSAMTFKVTGAGSFTHVITTAVTATDCNVVCNSHASSNIYIECLDVTLTADNTLVCRAVNAILGTVVLRCRNLTATGDEAATIWWENGHCDVGGASCSGARYGVYSAVDDVPTGDLHVSFSEINSNHTGVYAVGTNGDAALWIRANIISGLNLSVYNSTGNLNKTYIETQKLIGTAENLGGLLYIRSDKISPAEGASEPNLFVGGESTSISYIQIKHWDSVDVADYVINILDGEHHFSGAMIVGGVSSLGFVIVDGTVTIQSSIIDTSAYSSANPVVKSGGTLTLDGCTLVAEGTRNAIEAGTAQNVAVAGVLMANRPNHANVTLTGGMFVRSDTGAVTTNGAVTIPVATSLLLGTAGSAVGSVGFRNATSGVATLAPPTGALGTYTVTLPNAASTLPIFGKQITFSGPSSARTVTFPDANFTAARTDAANTFTGVQTFSSAPTSPGSGSNTERWGSSAATSTATNATAVGNGASVSGDYGTAVGRASSASTGAVAIGGFATASGTRSFCLAYNSTASHQDAYVFGSNGGVSYQNAGFTFHAASGAPAFFFTSYDDTSVEEMAGFTTAWATSTHASRKGRITISAFDTAAREGIRVEASGSAPMLGFYGTAAVAQQGTYTITAAPAVATALDCDANGGAYSGVPGALGDAATLVDLNNLRADVASLAAVVRQLIKHLGDTSGVGLVNETSY